MSNPLFYVCKHCGNLAGMVLCSGVPIKCCGEHMAEVVPNTVDASHEKHVPAVTKDAGGITVRVGSVAHPMEEKHYIAFVYVETKSGGQRKILYAGDEPVAAFAFSGNDSPVAVYAYCNIHGLWKCEL